MRDSSLHQCLVSNSRSRWVMFYLNVRQSGEMLCPRDLVGEVVSRWGWGVGVPQLCQRQMSFPPYYRSEKYVDGSQPPFWDFPISSLSYHLPIIPPCFSRSFFFPVHSPKKLPGGWVEGPEIVKWWWQSYSTQKKKNCYSQHLNHCTSNLDKNLIYIYISL